MALPRLIAYPLPTPDELPAPVVRWRPSAARSALLVHDLQRHFVRPFAVDQAPITPALRHIAQIVQAARAAAIPVLFTTQPASQTPAERGLLTDFWGHGLVGDDEGAQLVPELAADDQDVVLVKRRYDAFRGTDLSSRLADRGRDQLVVVGVYTHIGVQATALSAFMSDLQAFVVADATADFSRAEHHQALQYVAGRCGAVTTTAELLACWDASRPAG